MCPIQFETDFIFLVRLKTYEKSFHSLRKLEMMWPPPPDLKHKFVKLTLARQPAGYISGGFT
jgi:hypothetical protein